MRRTFVPCSTSAWSVTDTRCLGVCSHPLILSSAFQPPLPFEPTACSFHHATTPTPSPSSLPRISPTHQVFLDRRAAERLHDLPAIVASSRCFVFVLSNSIFESTWCLLELAAAQAAKVPCLAVRQDGSLWEGRSFPDLNASYIPATVVDQTGAEIKVSLLHELSSSRGYQNTCRNHFTSNVYVNIQFYVGSSILTQTPFPPPQGTPSAGTAVRKQSS